MIWGMARQNALRGVCGVGWSLYETALSRSATRRDATNHRLSRHALQTSLDKEVCQSLVQAKTTVRCPLSSTRCSVCQRTACARTRRSTSCPLACSMDTESS